MQCDDARALIGADLDGEATQAESAQGAEHLAGCPDCQAWREDVERLESAFAAPSDVTPLTAAAVAALGGGAIAGGAVAAGIAAAAVPEPRAGRRGLLLAGGLLAAALIAGTAYGLLSGGGEQATPIAILPSETASESASESPSESPSASPTTSPTASPSASPTASPSATATPSRSASVGVVTSPTATPRVSASPQPLTATARAGVLDLELHVTDSRPVRTISIRLTIVNRTDRAVTYRSPSCRELMLRVDGEIRQPAQTPGCESDYRFHTLEPGQAHSLTVDYSTTPGEHRVEGLFEGEDPAPSPDPGGGKPTPGPRQVQNATAGPIIVRVR